MKIWLPYVRGGSGTDVYTKLLARGFEEAGHEPVIQGFGHSYQYAPWLLRGVQPPAKADIVLANSWNGFAFHRKNLPLVVVEHHCVFDPSYTPYRSLPQALFHETLVRRFEESSFASADAIIAVSDYTATKIKQIFPGRTASVICNGIDTSFFNPAPTARKPLPQRPFRLIFVGNLTERKGADLLPEIMSELGEDFVLHYTRGLRTNNAFARIPNMQPMGRLDLDELREAYRAADALLFPTRLEGFGYAAAEAMACGLPVVATRGSSLPEIVIHGSTGFLCAQDDVGDFVSAIRELALNHDLRERMGVAGRRRAVEAFSLEVMLQQYIGLFEKLTASDHA